MDIAVVFDVGETLFDETRLWRLWATWLGIPDDQLLLALGSAIDRGDHHLRAIELFRPGFNLNSAREERRRAGVPDQFEPTDLYPDVEPCFRRLRQDGVRIAVAGNQPEGIEPLLKRAGLPFEFV